MYHLVLMCLQVGLIPHNKLLDLLAAAVSGDTINTIKYVKKLSECIEPSSFVSQLVNLVTNLLSGDPSPSSSSANRTLSKLDESCLEITCIYSLLLISPT